MEIPNDCERAKDMFCLIDFEWGGEDSVDASTQALVAFHFPEKRYYRFFVNRHDNSDIIVFIGPTIQPFNTELRLGSQGYEFGLKQSVKDRDQERRRKWVARRALKDAAAPKAGK